MRQRAVSADAHVVAVVRVAGSAGCAQTVGCAGRARELARRAQVLRRVHVGSGYGATRSAQLRRRVVVVAIDAPARTVRKEDEVSARGVVAVADGAVHAVRAGEAAGDAVQTDEGPGRSVGRRRALRLEAPVRVVIVVRDAREARRGSVLAREARRGALDAVSVTVVHVGGRLVIVKGA